MAAMPQQMSDSQDKSDDLIAELAKLMASNAQGADSKAEPAPKTPSAGETPAPSPAPLRIPGMNNSPAPAAAPAAGPVAAAAPEAKPAAAPAIRIPGMNQPAASAPRPVDPIVPPPVAAPVPQAKTEPKLGPSFDFGKPPAAAPVLHPEPLANWQTREVPKPAPAPTPAPAPSEPVLSVPLKSAPVEVKPQAPVVAPEAKPQAPLSQPAPMSRVEPVAHAPAPLAGPTAPVAKSPAAPSNAPAGDGFDFDFGFGKEPPVSGGNAPAHDPIADLIAAELDAAETHAPKAAEPPKPVLAPPPVPVRSFANPNQAPVLIAKPQGTRPVPAAAAAAKPLPAPAAAQRSENERFAVAPVFGLSGKASAASQAAPAQRAEPDPMDEIESLIGEAVRVELSPSEKAPSVMLAPPPPPSKPTVPPLSQTFAPRRADISKDRRDREPPMESAEAAILAAAAATGAQVDRVEAEDRRAEAEDRRPVKRMKVKPPKSRAPSAGLRQYIGMAVAGTLLLAAGLGLYWVLNMGRGDPSQAPVLTAEAAGPTKQPAPVVASAEPAEPASTGLFDQMQGNQTPVPTETLVSRDETEGAAPTEVARVVSTEDDTEGGLANRKVRTVTVRPDGTIVPGDEAVAGNEVLPVDRPNVPDIPGGEPEPSALLASVEAGSPDAAAEVNPDAIAAAISGETPVTAEVDPNAVSALLANAPEATAGDVTIDPTKVAPLPMPRPSDRTAMVGGANRAVELQPAIEAITPATEVAATAPAPQVTSNAGGAYSQLSSQPTQGDAQSSLSNLQARYGSLFGGNSLQIRQVDLGAKGTWYRVVLPTSSFQEATQVCASVKSNGGDCIPNNG